jgi:hypothetical protein
MQEPSRFGAAPRAAMPRGSETLCREVIDTESAHLVKAAPPPLAEAARAAAFGRYFPYPCDP